MGGGVVPDVKHFDPEHVLDQVVELFWRRGSASTGVGDVVAATGLSRSSLYATFGGKQELYLAALRRYVERRSRPVLEALAADGRGLPAIAAFFDQLIRARCEGPHARWGCMVSNAHAGARAVRMSRTARTRRCASYWTSTTRGCERPWPRRSGPRDPVPNCGAAWRWRPPRTRWRCWPTG
ncbi:TetR/AcrR family transcriptional regulator [Actinomadura madurae]|uniref:TetR/AcrR family transcriptional regulator n=1 Tax=Actinomadura madurae TaxID=1993 RepID=UPI0020D2126E|nr:TetR/AcrR family transcriptional regulator [Actinomadura madurae]MCP9947652.1 TetR/AcrR family transcriptional regulator [Actinomadura madurae]